MKTRRWAFLNELIPLALILLGLDYFVFEGRLFAWEPSPLWLLILLVAPRRGSVAGFASGLSAAAIYLWLMSEQGILWADILHRQPAFLIMPALFLLTGTYLGVLGESRTRRMEYFRDKAASLAAQLDSSEIRRTELERRLVEMEKRVAGQGATLLSLHDNFKKLDAATSAEEILQTLDIILRWESGAGECGVWRVSHGRAGLIAGGFGGPIPEIALAVGKNHRVRNAADWPSNTDGPPGADLAALISGDESERLVVALAGTPFAALTRDLALRFGMLAEHAGIVLRALRDRESLRRTATMDVESGLVSETYLRRRVNEEVALASRHKTRLALLACSIADKLEKTQAKLDIALSRSIRSCIRFSDGLAWFPDERAFVIVLPECDELGAGIVLKKIMDNLDMLNLRDDRNQLIYEMLWSRHVCDGALKGDAIFERLFSEMRVMDLS